jgi:hypothetical protein
MVGDAQARTVSNGPLQDLVEESLRLLGAAAEAGVPLRLVGGLAVKLHSAGAVHPALERAFGDIDFVTLRNKGPEASALIESLGYEGHRVFNTINAGRRATFYDGAHQRKLDLFIGTFEMCHVIPITERIELEPLTIPLAELLLTKLQVVHLTEKDQRDVLVLLYEHDVAAGDSETINTDYVARLCAEDWGLWRTVKLNIERTRSGIGAYALSAEEQQVIEERLEALWERIELEPKSRSWRLRDRVGDRKRWYDEPEEE